MKKEIVLPKQLDDGTPYVSYSQIKNWNSLKSFNLRILGKQEYILQYMFGDNWPDLGFAQFGTEVEEYILERKHKSNFNEEEKKVLNTIKPLGVFQHEAIINFDNFKLLGYIDDMLLDMTHIRDIKTASDNSRKQYYEDDYWQLDIYGMYVRQQTKKLPKKAEVVIVERAGNCFRGGGRKALSVKGQVWYHDRELTMERQKYLKEYIERTVQEISDCYKVFLKLNK